MDLHDGVIQTVYAVALHLEDAANIVARSPQDVGPVLDQSIENLHQVITDIRSYIFDLRAQVSEVSDLPGAIRGLAASQRVDAAATSRTGRGRWARSSLSTASRAQALV